MWSLVAGPLLLGLIIVGVILLPVGPVLVVWAKQLQAWVMQTLSTMRDIWRSE